MEIRTLSPNVSVGPQIDLEDLEQLAREGFTDIVCNRPDAEHPEDPSAARISKQAEQLGLSFHYLPMVPTEPFDAQARRLAELMSQPRSRIFAYCRSGARAANAWALAGQLAQGNQPPGA